MVTFSRSGGVISKNDKIMLFKILTSNVCVCVQSLSLAMSSDDDFDAAAYKEFEDQLYEEHSLSGLVLFWFCCRVSEFFLLRPKWLFTLVL